METVTGRELTSDGDWGTLSWFATIRNERRDIWMELRQIALDSGRVSVSVDGSDDKVGAFLDDN